MFDQTLIRVCLILGSFITAGYILRRAARKGPDRGYDLSG